MKDSGSKTIIFLDLVWPKVARVKEETGLKNLIVTSIKDYLPFPLNILYPFKAKKDGQWVDVPRDQGILSFQTLLN